MLTLWIAWAVLTLVVIMLAVARKIAARNEDEYVHLADGEATAIKQQVAVAEKLEKIDHWGKALTVADVLFGLVLLAFTFARAWQQGSQIN